MLTEIPSHGWKRNLVLRNAGLELFITLDVGPRIIRFAAEGGPNVFKEFPDHLGKADESVWRARGGHRFWTAPEGYHSYALDNSGPLDFGVHSDEEVEVIQPVDAKYGFQKTMRVALDEKGVVTIRHTLRNPTDQPLPYYPWALTVMDAGGVAVIPRPPLGKHPAELLPPDTLAANPNDYLPSSNLVMWGYTNLADPRYTFGPEFWYVRQDPQAANATKFGLYHTAGWVGYQVHGYLFIKSAALTPGAVYPDNNANFELYTDRNILELETLAPLTPVPPKSEVVHYETWLLLKESRPITDPAVAREIFSKL
jgi:hypothetical protein